MLLFINKYLKYLITYYLIIIGLFSISKDLITITSYSTPNLDKYSSALCSLKILTFSTKF